MEIELKEITLILKTDIIENLFQQIENEMIMNKFLKNIKSDTVEYKIHPTATMIKDSFVNFSGGDCMGFQKSCFLKHYRKNGDIFSISNKTENYWNWNLFLRKFKKMNIVENNIVENNIVENNIVENHIVENNIVEHNIVENKTHPTATMIK